MKGREVCCVTFKLLVSPILKKSTFVLKYRLYKSSLVGKIINTKCSEIQGKNGCPEVF